MEHDLGDASGGVELCGGVSDGAVGENVYDAGDLVVDASPVVDVHSASSCGVGDSGGVEQEVCGSATCGVDDHSVFECGVGEDVVGEDVASLGHDQGPGGSDGDVEPCGGARW